MGKVYYSPFKAYQYIVRPRRDVFTDGVKTDEIRELVAEFAHHGGEYTYENPDTGLAETAAVINGHFFDLDAEAEQRGWTPQETALIETVLDRACTRFPREIQLHTKAPAPKPWPTYDETHNLQIAQIAKATGTVAEAITYESENKGRLGIIAQLQEALEAEPEPVDPEAAPETVEDLLPAA